MALTRKLLTALGIEADKVEEIINAHTETVDALKQERDEYKKDAEKLPVVQKELDEIKEAAEKNANDPYKAQYEKVKAEFDQYKQDVQEKETKAAKREAYRKLLKDSGIADKFVDAVLKISDIDSVELDKDGSVKDAEAKKKSVKESYPEFIQTEGQKGAPTPTPPEGDGSGSPRTPSRAAQIAARYHESLYGKTKGE